MNLTIENLHELASLAINAALEAGKMIAKHSSLNVDVIEKVGGESRASQVVTEVDFKSQEIILECLKPSISKFDLALLTEELADDHSRFEKDYFWGIDPMDGTLPFIEETHGYSVSIGLVARNGISFIGVIYDPLKDIMYSAVKGQGLYRNGKLWDWKASQNKHLTFIHDKSFYQYPQYNRLINNVSQIAQELNLNDVTVIAQGGAALNACWILENSPACYFKFPKEKPGGGSLWDFAASSCIFNEAKAVVCNFKGEELDLNRNNSTFMNHEGVLYASSLELAAKAIKLY